MIYNVDFKNKKVVSEEMKKEEEWDDVVLEHARENLSIDEYEIYERTIRHYYNTLFIIDEELWKLVTVLMAKKHS